MIVRYRARALADIAGIFQYLEPLSQSGAQNVLRAIYAGIHLISEQPSAIPANRHGGRAGEAGSAVSL